MTLESCVGAGHGHNFGLLGHQVVDAIPLALQGAGRFMLSKCCGRQGCSWPLNSAQVKLHVQTIVDVRCTVRPLLEF